MDTYCVLTRPEGRHFGNEAIEIGTCTASSTLQRREVELKYTEHNSTSLLLQFSHQQQPTYRLDGEEKEAAAMKAASVVPQPLC